MGDTDQPGKIRRRRVVAILCVGAVLVTALLVWKLRNKGVEGDALTMLQAALANDPDTVYEFSSPGEREGVPISRESFRAMWAKLVAPRLTQYKVNGPIRTESMAPGYEGVAEVRLLAPNGRVRYLGAMVFETEGKSQSEIVRQFLVQAWRLDHYARLDAPYTQAADIVAQIDGLRADRATLISLGMKGTFTKPVEPIATWDAMMSQYDGFLRDEQAAASQGPK